MSEETPIQEILENEWSYLFDTDKDIEKGRAQLTLAPDDDVRKRLAQRLGLLSLDMLEVKIDVVQHSGSPVIHVKGHISAQLVQPCVVTLEPVPAKIKEDFESWFADKEVAISLAKKRREKESKGGHVEVRMLEEHDDPEPIVDGKIDLGELVTQYLSLAIDPYPHAEGVAFEVGDDGEGPKSPSPNNPFAALKDWKDKL